jgi:hypothetical protein
MIKIAVIKADGTWEEKKLRITRPLYSEALHRVYSHLVDKKFIINGELPDGVLEVAILPDNWERFKKKVK